MLPPPVEHPPGAWLRLAEAATYIRMTPSGLRTCVTRGQLVPDGRGPKGTHMFKVATLDQFLVDRTRCYTPTCHAAAGDREIVHETEGKGDTLPRREAHRRRDLPHAVQGAVPENRSRQGSRSSGAVREPGRRGQATRHAQD